MATVRAIAAIILIVAGTLLAARGPDGPGVVLGFVIANAETILFALAGLVLIGALARKCVVIVASILAGAGAAVYATRQTVWADTAFWTGAGLAMTSLGGGMILSRSTPPRDWSRPVQRVVALAQRRRVVVPECEHAPRYPAVYTTGPEVVIDLRHCHPSQNRLTEIAVTAVTGLVEILATRAWFVVAGRSQRNQAAPVRAAR